MRISWQRPRMLLRGPAWVKIVRTWVPVDALERTGSRGGAKASVDVEPVADQTLRHWLILAASCRRQPASTASRNWRSELLAAVETPVAEPGKEEYSGHQHDPADPEYPEDGGVRANERVDEQEAQGEQGNQDPYPRGATPHSHAVASTTPAISVDPVIRSPGIGSAVVRSTASGGLATWNGDAQASLHLSELADLVAVFPCVLARIDPLRLQVLG